MNDQQSPPLPLWTLVQTGHLVGQAYTRMFAGHGLTPAQFGVLACLADGDDLSQADLARAVLVRPQSMARLVTDLAAAGLIRRDGPGGRGRRTNLTLTEHGRRAVDRARPAAYAFDQPSRVGLTAAESTELIRLLTLVSTQLTPSDVTTEQERP
ncbi:MAG: MarR family winged helix-turn-helix transcriptional regulator [Propionibacteriaceae bacterium]